jgi:hypothetical protein
MTTIAFLYDACLAHGAAKTAEELYIQIYQNRGGKSYSYTDYYSIVAKLWDNEQVHCKNPMTCPDRYP